MVETHCILDVIYVIGNINFTRKKTETLYLSAQSLDMKPAKHILSKSTFMRGLKCQKSLWLNKYHKEVKDPVSTSQQAIFDRGNKVGQLARELFPNGLDATPDNFWDFRPSIKKTTTWLRSGTPIIYEATFQYEGVLSALDILISEDNKLIAYEVKSSTSVKEEHLHDAALQYYVMNKSGYEPNDFFIVTLNNEYELGRKISLEDLFNTESVIEQIKELQPLIQDSITQCKHTLAVKQLPSVKIGPQCTSPHNCDFMGYCWSDIPSYSIFNISRIGTKVWELYENGYLKTTDIPKNHPLLSENQTLQVHSDIDNSTTINKAAIENFLKDIEYPAFFMDFETFAPAIPMFKGTMPYQAIPFQYSIHISEQPDLKELKHLEFLGAEGKDPRRQFIERLINDLKSNGSIIVYNEGFEKRILQYCKSWFPEYAEQIDDIINRIVDLMLIFSNKDYYVPAMQGSYSIKKVLPALVPELDYSSLEIGSGDLASLSFESMINNPNAEENSKIRKQLLEYCQQDTLAMVKILQVLQNTV